MTIKTGLYSYLFLLLLLCGYLLTPYLVAYQFMQQVSKQTLNTQQVKLVKQQLSWHIEQQLQPLQTDPLVYETMQQANIRVQQYIQKLSNQELQHILNSGELIAIQTKDQTNIVNKPQWKIKLHRWNQFVLKLPNTQLLFQWQQTHWQLKQLYFSNLLATQLQPQPIASITDAQKTSEKRQLHPKYLQKELEKLHTARRCFELTCYIDINFTGLVDYPLMDISTHWSLKNNTNFLDDSIFTMTNYDATYKDGIHNSFLDFSHPQALNAILYSNIKLTVPIDSWHYKIPKKEFGQYIQSSLATLKLTKLNATQYLLSVYFHKKINENTPIISQLRLKQQQKTVTPKMQLAFKQQQSMKVLNQTSNQQVLYYFKTLQPINEVEFLIKSNIRHFSAKQEYIFTDHAQPILPLISRFHAE